MKVLDFSADGDQQPDSNGELTGATSEAGPLPESFTICSAFMTEAWTTELLSAYMFALPNNKGDVWGRITLFAASNYTEYGVWLGRVEFINQIETVFFPLQWSRACLSLDSITGKMMLVVDGQLLGEEKYKREEDRRSSFNVSLVLGFDPLNRHEYTGRVSNLNLKKC